MDVLDNAQTEAEHQSRSGDIFQCCGICSGAEGDLIVYRGDSGKATVASICRRRHGGHESSGIEHLFTAAEVEPSLTILVVAPDSSASPRSMPIAIDSISQAQSHR